MFRHKAERVNQLLQEANKHLQHFNKDLSIETLQLRKHFDISLEQDERFGLGTKDVPASIIANKLDLNLDTIEGIKHEMLLPKVEIPKFLSPEPKSKLEMI